MKKNNSTKLILFFLVVLFASASFSAIKYYENYQEDLRDKKIALLKNEINDFVISKKIFPLEINILDEKFSIEYTFQKELTTYIEKLVKQYRPDHSAIIVIDNATGKILSAVGYDRKTDSLDQEIVFKATHPSASLFKIITSAKLLEDPNIQEKTLFSYRGKSTTLYKSQLRENSTRWDRLATLKKAFANSNNAVFGKAAISNLSPKDILDMANQFGFNADLMEEISLPRSKFNLPLDDYHLAELASGFNTETQITPIHGALLSLVVANDGILVNPKIVLKITDEREGKEFWTNPMMKKKVLSPEITAELQDMMEGTIEGGTAKKSFRRIGDFFKKYLRIGGKTGTITGGIPYGKRDWFTAYATPKESGRGKGISICVMNVNINKWYVRSAFMARQIINYYYNSIDPLIENLSNKVAKAPKNEV
jgi:cell division protein FtsI/penicillin-binding protein 2